MTEGRDKHHVPDDWRRAADIVAAGAFRRILVVGPPDAGKSTLCRHLLAGMTDGLLLDADVGQKEVGPPAAVTLGSPACETGPPELRRLHFVGVTDPMGGLPSTLVGCALLAAACKERRLVVNTGGLVAGPGRMLKRVKAEAVAADMIIALAAGDEADAILADHRHLACLRLRPSPLARRRSAEERRAARSRAFAAYLAEGRPALLEGSVVMQAADLPREDWPGLLCGLAGRSGRWLGLGVVTGLRGRDLEVLTPAAENAVAMVRLGRLYLDPDGTERGRAPRAGG